MTARPLPKSVSDNPRLGQWLRFMPGGRLAVFTGKVELGQGILTVLTQIAAEELDLAPDRIDVISGNTARTPDEGFTAGSQSVQMSGEAVRLASAQSRQLLLAAAGERLDASPQTLSVADGQIVKDGTATNLDYWALCDAVDWTSPISGSVEVKAASGYQIVGQSLNRADLPGRFVGGAFIHDMSPAGMLHARVLRQPFRGAELSSFDEDRFVRRHPFVTMIRRRSFLAFVAASENAVMRAVETAGELAIWREPEAGWPLPEAPPEIRLRTSHQLETTGEPVDNPSLHRIDATYSRPLIAHASIGPSCALADFRDGRLTVWTHSQGVFALRAQIARVLGLEAEAVTGIHAPGAGCYGHNGADDAALDAAIIATMLPETPIRVQWTRADELSCSPLGASGEAQIAASLDENGRIAAWSMAVTSLPQVARPGAHGAVNLTSAEALDPAFRPQHTGDIPEAAGGGATRNAIAFYDIPQNVAVTIRPSRIRTSSLRSLGAHLNVFAIESAMDELADLANIDPLVFRLNHLSDPRARAVLEEVATMSGWQIGAPRVEGRAKGLGVARYKGKGAWCAAVAEVLADETIIVERLWLAVDAGLIVNPDGARNQIEGGALQALSWTLKEAVPVEGDRVPALDWERYPILRFSEVPQIETRFVSPAGSPSLGAGEPAQGPVSAAIANAAGRALGCRFRTMPLTREALLESLNAT